MNEPGFISRSSMSETVGGGPLTKEHFEIAIKNLMEPPTPGEEYIRMQSALRAMISDYNNPWLGAWPKEDLPPNPLFMELFE